jgi:RNA polymerase sigma factor (sigma-70 family)
MNEQDFELLRRFIRRGDQAAFEALVRRHLDLVYATAWRKLEDSGAAEEVAQNVFAALARKAWQFARDSSLPAWLHRCALLEAKNWLRGELRRRRREQAAAELGTTMKTPDDQTAVRALVPLLDEALLSLRESDRTALLLRYYENRSLREVGGVLGVGEDAAQKRVAAAVERLTRFFQLRGYRTATVAEMAATLQQTAVSAPEFVAVSVTRAALPFAASTLIGSKALLAPLLGLTKVQKTAAVILLVLTPLATHWARQAWPAAPAPDGRQQDDAVAIKRTG